MEGIYADFLTLDTIDQLEKSAALHDIGKDGLPDYILMKPGKLNVEEFNLMKQHTVMGKKALIKSGRRTGIQQFSSSC